MSVKCEEPKDDHELTVQVWLLYHHPNFDMLAGQNYRQTDDQISTRCPRQTFKYITCRVFFVLIFHWV